MIDGLGYTYKKDSTIFNDFFTNPINFSKDKYGNTVNKDSKLYNKSREIQNSIKDFKEGKSLISKIKTEFNFKDRGYMKNRESNLESYFTNKGEDFTNGFLSNFRYESSPFHLPTSTNGNAGDFIEEVTEVINELTERLGIVANKITHKKEYHSAKNALSLMENKK